VVVGSFGVRLIKMGLICGGLGLAFGFVMRLVKGIQPSIPISDNCIEVVLICSSVMISAALFFVLRK
jgi:hypothetical protein